MSSLATVNVNNLKSTKYGSTEVKKIMRGSDRLWPVFPIVLKLGDNFYNVNGIQNNEYVKTEYPKTRCYLGTIYSTFQTVIPSDNWDNYEFCLTSNTGSYIQANGGYDNNKDRELFYNSTAYNRPVIFWDYMANSSNGAGFNRLETNLPNNISSFYDPTNLTEIWIIEATTDKNKHEKRLRIKQYNSSVYTVNNSKSAYEPSAYNNNPYWIFGNTVNRSCVINVYYVKIYDKDNNLLGFLHVKNNNGKLGVYDEVSKQFLDYRIHPTNGTIYDHHEYDTIHTDKYIDMNPVITEYFEVDGTITEGSDTYERLVNNTNGFIIKGIKIET